MLPTDPPGVAGSARRHLHVRNPLAPPRTGHQIIHPGRGFGCKRFSGIDGTPWASRTAASRGGVQSAIVLAAVAAPGGMQQIRLS